jgi:serine/threonine-protein kinase
MVAGRLSHPNVVETIDAGERGGVYFIVEEAVEGCDLGERLRMQKRALPLEEALSIAGKTAAALEYAFAQGIVHLSVRPASIYLGGYGVVKLGDFGLARALGVQMPPGTISKITEWRGQANYIPPEQLASTANIDQRSDIYSLGATIYHMICGVAPFDAPTPMRVVRRIGEHDLKPVATLAPAAPRMVRLLVERCMEQEPARRYQTPHELLAAVEQCRSKLAL